MKIKRLEFLKKLDNIKEDTCEKIYHLKDKEQILIDNAKAKVAKLEDYTSKKLLKALKKEGIKADAVYASGEPQSNLVTVRIKIAEEPNLVVATVMPKNNNQYYQVFFAFKNKNSAAISRAIKKVIL